MDSRFGPGDVRFFDRTARLFDLPIPRVRGEWLTDALSLSTRPVERVVDIGGGTGRVAAAVDAPERLVADLSSGMLRRAQASGFEVVRADAGRLPLRAESVDAALVVDALHHMPNQRAAVDEAVRVLAPGGVLVVREFDPRTLRGRAAAFGERLLGFRSAFTPPSDMVRFLERGGLRARVVEGGFEYTVAGRKRESQ